MQSVNRERDETAGRYRLLLEQLRLEYTRRRGSSHGWKTWAAKRLQISPNYIGMLLTDPTRGVGTDAVQGAIQGLRLNPAFFFDNSLSADIEYRDFVSVADERGGDLERQARGGGDIETRDLEALHAFLGAGGAAPVTPSEISELRQWAAQGTRRRGDLLPEDFAEQLQLIRRVRDRERAGAMKRSRPAPLADPNGTQIRRVPRRTAESTVPEPAKPAGNGNGDD